jgi:hypothetical protein
MCYGGRDGVVKGFVIVVRSFGGYESGAVEVMMHIEYGGVVVQWVWEAVVVAGVFMACLQMELPMLIDIVIYVVYCGTVWLGGGCVVRTVCCNAWRSSATLSSPHELRWSIVLVMVVHLGFVACHVLGR